MINLTRRKAAIHRRRRNMKLETQIRKFLGVDLGEVIFEMPENYGPRSSRAMIYAQASGGDRLVVSCDCEYFAVALVSSRFYYEWDPCDVEAMYNQIAENAGLPRPDDLYVAWHVQALNSS